MKVSQALLVLYLAAVAVNIAAGQGSGNGNDNAQYNVGKFRYTKHPVNQHPGNAIRKAQLRGSIAPEDLAPALSGHLCEIFCMPTVLAQRIVTVEQSSSYR